MKNARKFKPWHKWTMAVVLAGLAVAVGFPIVWKLTHKADRKASSDFTELANQVADSAAPTTLGSAPTSTAGSTAAPTADSAVVSTAAPAATGSPGGGLEGPWATITPDATQADTFYVGYRVDEVLFGQNVTATGRTRDVTGTLVIDSSGVTAAEFTAQMANVTSDEGRRDNQFRSRIMAVDRFPTATFTLTQPIALGTAPADGVVTTFTAVGDFTAHGTTKSVTFELKAFRNGSQITVTGEIPIVFADWGIPNPTFGPATTKDHGSMEFLLTFEKSS